MNSPQGLVRGRAREGAAAGVWVAVPSTQTFSPLGEEPPPYWRAGRESGQVSRVRASGNFQRWWPHAAHLLRGKYAGSLGSVTKSLGAYWHGVASLGNLLNIAALQYLDQMQQKKVSKQSNSNNSHNSSWYIHNTYIIRNCCMNFYMSLLSLSSQKLYKIGTLLVLFYRWKI